jgi:serine protease Do
MMDFDTIKKEHLSTVTGLHAQNPAENHLNRDMNNGGLKRFHFKPIVSIIAAGVIGSVVTLTVLPYTGYGNKLNITSTKQPVAFASSSGSVTDMVVCVSKAIVSIENYQQPTSENSLFGRLGNFNGIKATAQPDETGSGIIFQKLDNTVYIVTNHHVIENSSRIVVSLYNGTKMDATLVGADDLSDLAVLVIHSKDITHIAQFGDSSTIHPGDPVFAIGDPLGLNLSRTVTSGIVSGTNRTVSETTLDGNWGMNMIQTDAAISPGNSGGALLNDQGLVMGINTLKIAKQGVEGIGFAIPSNDAVPIVNQLIQNGKIERPYLGADFLDVSDFPRAYLRNLPEKVTKGVVIIDLDPQSAAAVKGLKKEDIIVSMNGTRMTSSSVLRKYLYTKVKNEEEVNIGFYHNGRLLHILVKLGAKAVN